MNELRTAIYAKTQEASSFNTAIGGRFYFDRYVQRNKLDAPVYPYVVAHEIIDDYSFTFQEDFQDVTVQFNIYSNKIDGDIEVGTIYNYLKALIDWKILSVSGYVLKKIERKTSRQFWDDTKDEYVYVVDYLFMLQKS